MGYRRSSLGTSLSNIIRDIGKINITPLAWSCTKLFLCKWHHDITVNRKDREWLTQYMRVTFCYDVYRGDNNERK